jgi:hypothetical protein
VRIILKWIVNKYGGRVDYLYLAQDTNQRCVLVSMAINLLVSQKTNNFYIRLAIISFLSGTLLHGASYWNKKLN